MDSLLDTPLVTIAIPCYNHAVFVQDSIRSVINQTYKNIELIIIDDGSTDQSVNKIKEMLNESVVPKEGIWGRPAGGASLLARRV